MSELKFISDIPVEMIRTDFDDKIPVLAARTSTLGAESTPQERDGLIKALIREGHGVPFEHMHITFRVTAPIFVWRQVVKHRAGVSLSEESGRYRELKPVFYVPPGDRPLVQTGKPMEYQFEDGTAPQIFATGSELKQLAREAWGGYQYLLDEGVAREVARMVLPLNTMSTGIITFNARSLMKFLELRTSQSGSHPQWEIERLAEDMGFYLALHAPITYLAFTENGYKAP